MIMLVKSVLVLNSNTISTSAINFRKLVTKLKRYFLITKQKKFREILEIAESSHR